MCLPWIKPRLTRLEFQPRGQLRDHGGGRRLKALLLHGGADQLQHHAEIIATGGLALLLSLSLLVAHGLKPGRPPLQHLQDGLLANVGLTLHLDGDDPEQLAIDNDGVGDGILVRAFIGV